MERRGGARENGGRKKGIPNKKTQELIARVQSEGLMPLDIFLNDMRYFYNLGENKMRIAENTEPGKAQAKEFRAAAELKSIARDCGRDAAPYVHARLASLQANVSVTNVEAELAELE